MINRKSKLGSSILSRIYRFIKRKMWVYIVAFMVGIHNFYKQEDKTPDNISIKIEYEEATEDSAPKD